MQILMHKKTIYFLKFKLELDAGEQAMVDANDVGEMILLQDLLYHKTDRTWNLTVDLAIKGNTHITTSKTDAVDIEGHLENACRGLKDHLDKISSADERGAGPTTTEF